MADYTVIVQLADHKLGDRWPGIPVIGPVLINGFQPEDELARVRMHFVRPGRTFRCDSTISSKTNAPIIITNGVTWEAVVPPVEKFLSVNGDWAWDMEFYAADNESPLTLYKGVLKVFYDVTR